MSVLERCLYWRDVCIGEMFVLEEEMSVLEEEMSVLEGKISILARCLYQNDVCIREMSVIREISVIREMSFIREISVSNIHLFKRDVCVKWMSILQRNFYKKNFCVTEMSEGKVSTEFKYNTHCMYILHSGDCNGSINTLCSVFQCGHLVRDFRFFRLVKLLDKNITIG